MLTSEQSTQPRHAPDLYQNPGQKSILLWIQYLPDPEAVMTEQHGLISEFTHHPTHMGKVESRGPFAGETKLDAWLFKNSKFLRAHFKNNLQHTEANDTVFQHESDAARHRSDTTGSAESRPTPAETVPSSAQRVEDEGRLEHHQQPHDLDDDEIQVGEEAPGHAVTSVRDVSMHKGGRIRKGSARSAAKWAFWNSGKE